MKQFVKGARALAIALNRNAYLWAKDMYDLFHGDKKICKRIIEELEAYDDPKTKLCASALRKLISDSKDEV